MRRVVARSLLSATCAAVLLSLPSPVPGEGTAPASLPSPVPEEGQGEGPDAKTLKTSSIDQLEAITGMSGNLKRQINRARKSIGRSLVRNGEELFVSGNIIVPPAQGLRVFYSERIAVRWLQRAMNNRKCTPVLEETLAGVIAALVEADRLIAYTAIDNAETHFMLTPEAEENLARAKTRYEEGLVAVNPVKAIRKFQRAWRLAYQAMNASQEIIPLKWARKLYDPEDPVQTAIGRNGDVEEASTDENGEITLGSADLQQWSGDNMAGSRSWAGNTLVAAPDHNYMVALEYWDIREGGVMGDGTWKYFPRMMQDAQLRFGYLEPEAANLPVTHGTDFGLDGALPYDSIMLCLPFRIWLGSGRTVWHEGWHAGNPVSPGVWQVFAGDTIRDAQKDKANWLGKLPFLSEVTPEHRPSFKLQVGDNGSWQVLTDIDRDGEVDIDITSDMAGNKPSVCSNVSLQSGLWITTGAAGGMRGGRVGRSPMTVSYEYSPVENVPTTPRNRRPLTVNIPAGSYVSPCIVEGKRWNENYQVFVTASTLTDTEEVTYLDKRSFTASVPLDEKAPVSVSFEQNCVPPSAVAGSIEWLALDLSDLDALSDYMNLKEGESILLTATGPGSVLEIDVDGDGSADFTGAPGDKFVATFDSAGSYEITATIDGAEVGSLQVNVLDVLLPSRIVARVGRAQKVTVEMGLVNSADDFVFEALDPADLEVTVDSVEGPKVFLNVKPKRRGTPVLAVRLASDDTLVASQEVDEFTVENRASGHVVFDADTGIGTTEIIIHPYLESIGLEFTMFASQSTFSGGLTKLRLDNEENDDIEKVWDEVAGEYVGVVSFDIEMPPWEDMYCFSSALYPGESPIDWSPEKKVACAAANSKGAWYRVERVYACRNKIANTATPQRIQFMWFTATGCAGHTPKVITPAGVAPLEYVGTPKVVYCTKPNMPPHGPGNTPYTLNVKANTAPPGPPGAPPPPPLPVPDPGEYDVKIEQTTFDDRVVIVEGDLVVYDGLNGWGGGAEVAEDKEDSRGAFTVLNDNDSDSDGTADIGDSDTNVPGEKDLFKIIIKRPEPVGLTGKIKLHITGQDALVWKSADKSGGRETVSVPEYDISGIPAGGLVRWIEALSKSGSLRDVSIYITYEDICELDHAKATFVWAARTRFLNSGSRLGATGDTQFPNMDGTDINASIAAVGDTFGHGSWLYQGIPRIGNRELSEWKVGPPGIGDEDGIVFDITRQGAWRVRKLAGGVWVGQNGDENFPAQDEEPNDDGSTDEEDNDPLNDFIYSFDAPNTHLSAGYDFIVARHSFLEFIRVRFDGQSGGNFQAANQEAGSRCSGKHAWHSLLYLKRDTNGNLTSDPDAISASAPRNFVPAMGTMSVPVTSATTVTEWWTTSFSTADNRWSVRGSQSGVQTAKAATDTAYSSDNNEVSFTITAGNTPATDGTRIDFSTFKSSYKVTEVDTGPTDVTLGP